MNTKEIIIRHINELPEFLHLQIIDYIEYLYVKYNITDNQDKMIDEEHINILRERYEKYKMNPDVGDDWEVVKKRLLEKFAS